VTVRPARKNLTEQMTTRLKLNDDQKTKVADINDRYAAEMKASMEERKANKAAGETVDREADRAKLKEVTAKKNAELKVVLTPEQMTEWQKMQGEMREKGKERMQERHDKNKTKSAE
jgi:Spy/CpxP family protein refolding chaperone